MSGLVVRQAHHERGYGRWPVSSVASLRDTGISLYVHVPFCQTKCPYCDFNTYQGIEGLMAPYVEALVAEIGAWGRALDGPPVNTVFFGGGTPSYLPDGDLGRILEAIERAFGIGGDAEVTVEANPGDLTADKAASLLRQGINRVSIGVQSLDNDLLNLLGRRHDAEGALAAFRTVRDCRIRERQPGPDLRAAAPITGAVAGHAAEAVGPGTGPYFPVRPDRGGGYAAAPLGGTGRGAAARRGPGGGHVPVRPGTAGRKGLPPLRDIQLVAAGACFQTGTGVAAQPGLLAEPALPGRGPGRPFLPGGLPLLGYGPAPGLHCGGQGVGGGSSRAGG